MRKLTAILLSFALAGFIFWSCSDENSPSAPVNRIPVIENIVANPAPVKQGGSSRVTCIASDADGDELIYSWYSSGGTIIGEGSLIEWSAPNTIGKCTISVIVSDGSNEAVQSIFISVREPFDPGEMVLIPGGTYFRGDHFAEGYSFERPIHEVTVDSFFVGKNLIRQGEWADLIGRNPSYGYQTGDDYPVYNISWYYAIKYCNLRSILEGFDPVYSIDNSTDPEEWGIVPANLNHSWNDVICDFSKNGYRLLTEAEWEYAARGGLNGQRFPDGLTISHSSNGDTRANYNSLWLSGEPIHSYDISPTEGLHPDHRGLSPVGSFPPNGYGLNDMAGGLWELTWDWWNTYTEDAQVNPTGPLNPIVKSRVRRGGSWQSEPLNCRVSSRYLDPPYHTSYDIGFRIARTNAHNSQNIGN